MADNIGTWIGAAPLITGQSAAPHPRAIRPIPYALPAPPVLVPQQRHPLLAALSPNMPLPPQARYPQPAPRQTPARPQAAQPQAAQPQAARPQAARPQAARPQATRPAQRQTPQPYASPDALQAFTTFGLGTPYMPQDMGFNDYYGLAAALYGDNYPVSEPVYAPAMEQTAPSPIAAAIAEPQPAASYAEPVPLPTVQYDEQGNIFIPAQLTTTVTQRG